MNVDNKEILCINQEIDFVIKEMACVSQEITFNSKEKLLSWDKINTPC
jgi:hypothetical protein